MRIGAIHGFAANTFVMIRGRHLIERDRADEVLRRIHQTVHATVLIEGPHANWPNNVGPATRPASLSVVVQHCNGAPGIINSLAEFPRDARWPIDAFVATGGRSRMGRRPDANQTSQLVPRRRRQRLRVPEVVYAHRQRQMARSRTQICDVRTIVQCDSALEKYGRRKFSLSTGDIGLAIYLWNCVQATAKFPTLGCLVTANIFTHSP